MNQTEFRKFLNSLSKKELIEMVLSFTKGSPDIRDYLYEKFKKEEELEFNFDQILSEFKNVDRKVFNKSWMHIGSQEVGKYCRETNKIIRKYINPLIKNKKYYDAFSLLVEVYWLTVVCSHSFF